MSKQLSRKVGDYGFSVTNRTYILSEKEGSSVTLHPSHTGKVVKLLHVLHSMVDMKAFPPQITDGPVSIQFTTSDDLYLKTSEQKGNGLKFTWDNRSDISRLVQEADAVCNDKKILR